jgi:putative copper resistance protein D
VASASTDSPARSPARLKRITVARAAGRPRVWAYAAATAIAGVAVLIFGMWFGGNLVQRQVDGLLVGGQGNVTTWGLMASKFGLDVASVGVIGMLAGCLLLPVTGGGLGDPARRCLRTAGWLALAWGVANAALLMFSWSDVVAQPVTTLPVARLFTDAPAAFPSARAYLSSTALALVISAAVAITRTRRGALIVLPLALYNLTPMALQGHAAHGTVLKFSLAIHVIVVSLWVGGLAALLIHARGEPAALAVAVPRFSTLALACYAAVAATGLIAAWELLGQVSLAWTTRYGVLVILKATALITLGILGWWHRRHTVRRVRAADGPLARSAFIRLAAAEVIVMVAAIALAVALSRTASPDTILLHSGR